MMIFRYIISMIVCIWLAFGCHGNILKKSKKQNTVDYSIQKIECFYVVGHRPNIIYTIQNDSLYYDGKTDVLERKDVEIINASAELVDSIKTLYNGACIENDAVGVLYRITTGDNISEWINCFPSQDVIKGETRKIMDVFDKYFLFAYKEIYNIDYPCTRCINTIDGEVENINSQALKRYYREYSDCGKWLITHRNSYSYREDGYNYIYTDHLGKIRKLIFDEFSEDYHLYLVAYYDNNGYLVQMLINISSLTPKYFTEITEPTITGNISREGETYSADLKFTYSIADTKLEIKNLSPEIKFPFLGEIDLSAYLSVDGLKKS